MKERSIILHTHEVRRLLDAGEVQVWRPIDFPLNCLHIMGNPVKLLGDWPLSEVGELVDGVLSYEEQTDVDDSRPGKVKCPFQPGEQRWVKETWAPFIRGDGGDGFICLIRFAVDGAEIEIPAELQDWWDEQAWNGYHNRSPILLPERLSRLTVEIVDVGARRVQDVTEEDARAVGADKMHLDDLGQTWSTYRRGFQSLWDSRYAKRYPWESNPWTWVIELRRVAS